MYNFIKNVAVCLAISASAAANAAEYWVSKNGNDANNCSSTLLACLSIQKGLNLLKQGDTLTIDEGIYIEDSTNSKFTSKCGLLDADYGSLCVKSSGTADNPIIIRAQPGKEGSVIIDSESKRAGLIISKHDYIRVRGLTFKNNWSGGIATPGGPASVTSSPNDDILSIGCVIEGNTILHTTGGFNTNISGIYMWSTKDWIVRNNVIDDVYADSTAVNGIQTYGTINAIIENNTITNVPHGIQWKDHYLFNDSYQESVIRKNKLSVTQTGVRISIRGDGSNAAGDNQIENNIIELSNDSTVGVAAYLAGANAVSRELIIKNNLFIGRNSHHMGINADSLQSLRVTGNVFVNMETAISLRLQDGVRAARLTESNYNVFDAAFQIINDRYDPKGGAKTYRVLDKWKAAQPSIDKTLISLAIDSPDKLSVQLDNARLLATQLIGNNYSSLIPTITDGKGAKYQPGPYQKVNDIIGASKDLQYLPLSFGAAPSAPGNAKHKGL